MDQASGHLYIADQGNSPVAERNLRIVQFTAWGEFGRAWGWDVVATGPGDDLVIPEDQFEICVPDDGDICKAGTPGTGAGQFGEGSGPQGVAVDSQGNVYVVDRNNRRVQKFDPDGNFLLMIGGGVNQGPTHPGNLCTAAHLAEGDTCGAGTVGSPGPGEGQFGGWPVASFISIGPGDLVYVGDQERIQKFNPNGTFNSQIALPGSGFVSALAVTPTGNLYAGFASSAVGFTPKPNVLKLDPAGAPLCTIEAASPRAIAAGPAESLYVVDTSPTTAIRQFDSSCVDKLEPFGVGEIETSTGIAISTACNVPEVSVYVSNTVLANSFVRAYGSPPDPEVCPPPVVPPTISSQYATAASTGGAVVRAEINPHWWPDTTYYVEYGLTDCASGGCAKQPLAPLDLDGDGVDEDVTTAEVELSGLEPGTTYHYRFVAESGGGGPVFGVDRTFTTFPTPRKPGSSDCPVNQIFRTGASAHLPDCRAYEMVSPVDKNNGDLKVLSRFTGPNYPALLEQSSGDGDRITYSSATAFGDALGAPWTSQYLATRQAGNAWLTHGITPPRGSKSLSASVNVKLDVEFKKFSEDLCSAWLVHDTDPVLAPGAVEGFLNIYRRENCGQTADSYEAITTVMPPTVGAPAYQPELQGVAADGASVFFAAEDKLTDDAPASPGYRVYERSNGELHYVCVLPDGEPSEGTCTVGAKTTNAGQNSESLHHSVARAISEDGTRVFWTASGPTGSGPLYVRKNPAQEQSALVNGDECTEPDKACTVAISEGNARFWTAATDGSKAVYTVAGDLFEFDVDQEEATLIAAGAIGVAGASEDISRIYFVSTEVLTGEEENSEGRKAQAGKPNLYLFEAGSEGEEDDFAFISTLSADDVGSANAAVGAPFAVVSATPMRRATRVSPSGAHLAFVSNAESPTGYDNLDVDSGEPDSEVYLYSASADELDCVSCNPSGARPSGQRFTISTNLTDYWTAAQFPTWTNQFYAPRVLSDDGERLFFESFDALVLRDTNGKQDVYEWSRGTSQQDCEERLGAELFVAEAGGCISLISSGESSQDSEFADATPDGSDVFFRTAASLVSHDPGLIDLYDARVGGGLPPLKQPPPICEGELCQNPLPAPGHPGEASAVASPQSIPPYVKRCPKGKRKVKVKGKVRCVKKRKGKRQGRRTRRVR